MLNSSSVLTGFVPIAGGTMTGPLILSGDPVLPLGAATKEYVDMFASGLMVILAVQAATTANLNATQAGAGVGATLTNAGAMAAFAVDGYSASVNDRILVKDQTLSEHNGIYNVTTVGSGAVNWVLTRSTDYDTNAQIVPGTLVPVINGTVNASTSWVETATVVTVDTDPVVFAQFSFSGSTFLQKANNLSDVASVATSLVNLGLGTPTGTVNVVLSTSPTLITPILGVATATSLAFNPTTNGIIGTTTNDSAMAGRVGEYIESNVLQASAVALVNATGKDITTLSLTAGDWDVEGNVCFIPANTTVCTTMFGAISLASNNVNSTYLRGAMTASSFTGDNSKTPSVPAPIQRISINGPTTVFLVAYSDFSVSTCGAFGFIRARRIR